MQSLLRHQHQFDAKQFPFSLYRLSDAEYSQLLDRSFPIRINRLFLLKLVFDRLDNPDRLTLPKALLGLEDMFGASSSYLDRAKQAFSFPLLLAIVKPSGTFYHLLQITDRRGSVDFDLYRIIDDIKYADRDLMLSSEPITDELSQLEIEYIIIYLWGFLEGFSHHIHQRYPKIEPFFRQIDSNHIIYGYWDGKFVEEEIEDNDEYDRIVGELEARYGRPETPDTEKVASIQALIQTIAQDSTGVAEQGRS
jgi:hypothetical protein